MLEIKRFTGYICRFYVLFAAGSLSDAKVAEDRVEHLVGGCAAAYLRQGVGGVAQVEAQYLGGLSLKQFAPHLLDL